MSSSSPSIVVNDRQPRPEPSRPRPRSLSSRSRMSSHVLSDDEELEWDETIDGEFDGLGLRQEDEDALLRTREREREERRKRRKKDEPMSPAAVVFYVIALYLIFQILTRSDESEILSHLPSTSNLRQSHHSSNGNDGGHGIPPYHLPYNFPQIPNPIPSPPLSPTTSNSIWRIILSVIIYPFYVLLTIISVPLPLVLHLLYIMKDIAQVLLYPLTTTAKLFYKTFVAGPSQVVKHILDVFYPLYVFIGGVVTVGCVIGASAGWAGRVVLDSVLRWKDGGTKKSRRTKSRRSIDPAAVAAAGAAQVQAAIPKRPAERTTTPMSMSMESRAPSQIQSSIARPPWSVVDTIRPSDSASQVRPRPTPTSSYPRSNSNHRLSSYSSSRSKDKDKERDRDREIYTPLREIKIVHEPISLFDDEHDEDEDSEATIRTKNKSNNKRITSSMGMGSGKGKSKQLVEESSADERAGAALSLARSSSRAAVVKGIRRRGVRERY